MKAEVIESKSAEKDLVKTPREIVRSYEIWVRLVETHGISILRNFKGYHDEKLKGDLGAYRSSRLNLKWRVIYRADTAGVIQIINVVRVTAHDYRSV